MSNSTFPRSEYYCFFFLFIVCRVSHFVSSQITYVKRDPSPQRCDIFGSTTHQLKCNEYGNAYGSSNKKECTCPVDQPTFLYFNNKCKGNSFVEGKLISVDGCSLVRFVTSNDDNSPYQVFDLQQNSTTQTTQLKVESITGKRCRVKSQSFIKDYDGQLVQNLSNSLFGIDIGGKRLSWDSSSSQDLTNVFYGRVVMLITDGCTFQYYSGSSKLKNPCIVFKVKGKLSFNDEPFSSPSSIKTTPVATHSASFHPSKSSMATVLTSSLFTTPIFSTQVHEIPLSSGTFTPTATIHGSSATSSSAVTPNKGKSKGQRSPIGAILGTVFAVVGVMVIIVLVVCWRRKLKTNEEREKDINKDNPAYGRGETINLSNPQNNLTNKENSDLEYDYAAVDGDPRASNGQPPPGIYQSLTHDGNRESVYTPLDRQQDNPLEESTGYDKIDHTVFQPGRKGPTDPQYNVLQRPNKNKPNQEYLEPGVHIDRNKISSPRQAPQSNEPVYNVLEDPSPGGIADEPEYNVLEDPNGQHDPKYNVLEDPEGQYEPEYNVLEAPDSNHDKGPAKGHPSSHDNVGYASTIALKPRGGSPVYAAPEGPISEPTYQPLTINAPDDSVYQPLDRRSRIVPDDQPVYHVLESATSTDA